MGEQSGTGEAADARDGILTPGERRRVAIAAGLPVVAVLVVLLVLVATAGVSLVDVVVGTVVYGGLLGLTSGVVAHERAAARHCPRCGVGTGRDAHRCPGCHYDLVRRPVFLCPEGHERGREPGLCACGRRLVERVPRPGLGRSVRRTLWAGVWLLVFLVGTAILLRLTG